MENKLIPNSTQVPNVLLDFVIPGLPEGEAKCMLYICRRTYGFHKDQDRISFSQFITGIKNKDIGSGVSRPVVAESLRNLVDAGAVLVRKDSRGNIYKINLDMDFGQVVRKVNQLRKTSKKTRTEKPKQKNFFNYKKPEVSKQFQDVCLVLKKWNNGQSSPMQDFVPEHIVKKHTPEKVEQMIKYYGQRNNGFSLFMTALKA